MERNNKKSSYSELVQLKLNIESSVT